MTKKTDDLPALEELEKKIAALPGDRMEAAMKLLTEILFLEDTLNTLKDRIIKDGPVIKTARTVKENPAMRAYNTSIQRYSLLFKQLIDLLPAPEAKPQSDPVVDFIRAAKQ